MYYILYIYVIVISSEPRRDAGEFEAPRASGSLEADSGGLGFRDV